MKAALLEAIKLAFDHHGISIPFPQRDVHLIPAPSTTQQLDAA